MIISFIKNSNCIDNKRMGFGIGGVFTEKKLAHILVTSSLSGQDKLEFDTIYLQ